MLLWFVDHLVLLLAALCVVPGVRATPLWYRQHRIHAHTRLAADGFCAPSSNSTGVWTCRRPFDTAAADLASLGVKVYVRHTHTAGEGTWWPSDSDPRAAWHPLVQQTNRSLPREFLQRARAANVTVLFYHYMKCNQYYATHHPSWIQRGPTGTPIPWNRCPYGGMSTCSVAWQDTYIAQVVQLARMGAAGFYFDEFPGNPGGDWSPACRQRFLDTFGEPMPNATVDGADFNGLPVAVDRRIHTLMSNVTVEYFRRLNAALRRVNPDIVSLTSVYQVPKINNGRVGISPDSKTNAVAAFRRVNYGLYETTALIGRNSPNAVAKTEFTLPARMAGLDPAVAANLPPHDILMTFGWSVSRDAAAAAGAPHVWNPFLNDSRRAVCSAAALVAYGCVANLDHSERAIPNVRVFNETYHVFGRQLDEKVFARWPELVPVAGWAAILFSERSRNRFFPDDGAKAWSVLWPVIGTWEAFVRRGVAGVRVVTDGTLAGGLNVSATPVLLTPPRGLLDPRTTSLLASYQQDGGRVLEVDGRALANRTGRASAEAALFDRVVATLGVPPPVRVTATNTNTTNTPAFHVVAHTTADADTTVIFVVNNFTDCVGVSAKAPPDPTPPPPSVSGLVMETPQRITSATMLSTTGAHDQQLNIVPPQDKKTWQVPLPTLTNVLVVVLSTNE